ncbi:site-specific tyrosine recombinase XerC [Mycoavidus cysteinexigens]|uniref:Tyrosine recombinase XerC n=1 Tax=Mycoavidus cysteinexigens TaxID=1553431 RepID=A0A2Z6ES61_9BURK|nr:tyrosine recombinase XerC [Mycoavidus cysteinexigens]BBE08238.1 site-specific tyrosine recombinase XerC [Mycoavidus cysteinexigens]GAM53055.1 tyrosine recombinase XerC [bacterium endosymbiont of Mortierella elongata FMR23-6]GLR02391.1 tyrosine recombinase XerC [Mycoavidus cysteinexigens]
MLTVNALADPISAYLDSLIYERKLSKHTLTTYAYELTQLVALAGTRALNVLTPADIREGVIRAHTQGLAARSIARRLSVWRSFYRWLALHTALENNPVAAVRAPKRAKTLPKALSVDDSRTMMEANQSKLPHALRDCAMVELFYSSGLRLAELIHLDLEYKEQTDGYRSVGWLDLPGKQVYVTGKGNRQRTVPIGRKAITALLAWLTVRPQFVREDARPLFLSSHGRRISASSVKQRVKRVALTAGIAANVHPHVLRHSFASHVLQSSGDLRAVQEMLGHASISTTQIYTSLDFQHLAKIYDQAHPRARKRS